MPRITVHPITISKEKLDEAPEEERLTYLMAGNLANDLLTLQKLLVISSNTAAEMGEAHSTPVNGSTLLIVKLLAGRLYEGWNWLRGPSTTHIKKLFAQDKSCPAWICYREITGYFGRENIIEKLRQKVGFHADAHAMQEGYALLGAQPVTEFVSEQRGNSFYGSADMALIGALCHLAGTNDVAVALGRVADEISHVSGLFGDLVVQIAMHFCIDVLDIDAQGQLNKVIEIDVPALGDLRLPYFSDGKLSAANDYPATG